jgi:protein ImuB
MHAQRIAAIWVPGLSLQCAARDDASLREQPVAITDGTVVLERNRRAVEAGITVGMRVAEAVTIAADLLLVPHDPQGVQAVWDAVLLHLDGLGPVVEDAGFGEALVDVSGVGNGERMLVRRSVTALARLLQLTLRAAVADGPTVATIAARRSPEMTILPRGQSAAFLARQPVTCLPLPASLQEELALLGIRTVGGFAGLRPSDVQRRFGAIGMAALALALGQDDRPLVPRARERGETAAHTFEPPVEDLTPVLFVTKSLLDNLASMLRREGEVAHGLRLTLTFEGQAPLAIEQDWGMARIPGHAELDGLRLALDTQVTAPAGGGMPPRIAAIAVSLHNCRPDTGVQLPLSGSGTIVRRQAVARLLTRLHALLGPESVVEAIPSAAHLPEEGWEARPYTAERVGTPVPTDLSPMPGSLLPPVPGFSRSAPPEPIALIHQGEQLAAIRSGETEWEVITALGPYMAEGRWWEAGRYARAYWLLLTADQGLHLVAQDCLTGRWARYGMFD